LLSKSRWEMAWGLPCHESSTVRKKKKKEDWMVRGFCYVMIHAELEVA
jgi:hypothetical protein